MVKEVIFKEKHVISWQMIDYVDISRLVIRLAKGRLVEYQD